MAGILRNLKVNLVALVDKGANQAADIVLFKRRKAYKCPECGHEMGEGGECEQCKGKMDKSATSATVTMGGITVPVTFTVGTPAPLETPHMPDPEVVAKADYEALRKSLDEANTKTAEAVAKAAALEDEKKSEVMKAKIGKYDKLPGVTADLAPLFRKVYANLDEAEAAKLDEILAGANEAIRTSTVFTEIGSGRTDGSGAALGKLQAVAKTLKDGNPRLSSAEAMAEALSQHPELYREYLSEAK